MFAMKEKKLKMFAMKEKKLKMFATVRKKIQTGRFFCCIYSVSIDHKYALHTILKNAPLGIKKDKIKQLFFKLVNY